MEESKSANPARRPERRAEHASLFGLVSFRPRLTVVLLFLTLAVAVMGSRIYLDSGLHRAKGLVREGLRLHAAASSAVPASAEPRDPAGVEERIAELSGANLSLPRDDRLFAFRDADHRRIGKVQAVIVPFTYERDSCLLLVVPGTPRRAGSSFSLFSEPGFLSGEKGGRSFVYWEKGGTAFIVVSGADLVRTFDLVRRYFN